MNKSAPPNLCRLPWFGISNDPTGLAKPCCIFKGEISDENGKPYYVQSTSVKDIFCSEYMKKLRQQFRNNERPVQCSTCWADEEAGYTSKRQIYADVANGFIDNTNTDFIDSDPTSPVEFQLILSNSCNLKCRSCGPSHSSLWAAEAAKFPSLIKQIDFPNQQSGSKDGILWGDRFEWYKTLRRLEIVGGETFYIKQWHTVWQELQDLGYSKKIKLDMSSNCIIIYPDMVRNLAANFERVGLAISIDGLGPQFEYLRHPGKWDKTDNNIRQYVALSKELPNFHCQATVTVSWLNAWYLPEIVEYFNSLPMKVWLNIIHYPPHMAIKNAPLKLKYAIINKWSKMNWGQYSSDIEGLLATMQMHTPSEDEVSGYLQTLSSIDGIRTESYKNTFPEIIQYLH
jgi:hypothetical protein